MYYDDIIDYVDKEMQYVKAQMRDMTGPLSYYRTTDHRFEEEKGGFAIMYMLKSKLTLY
jgi:hypothetical protein